MRTLLVLLTMALFTPTLGFLVIVAGLVRLPRRPGGVYDWVPEVWSRLVMRAGGARLVLHHPERIRRDTACVYVANHMSWFDVFTLASALPRCKFVAKQELVRIPIFGPAVRSAGTIFIDRGNKKAAMAVYDAAAARVRDGISVAVFPEGTRGVGYALRPFKKGPFVLAIAAGVPIVPTVIYGTREVQRRGFLRVRSGTVHVHFLEEIETAGLTYDDRDRLARDARDAMGRLLLAEYGVSPAIDAGPTGPRPADARSADAPASV